ncbi:MAG: phosphoglycolate phosphatase [Sphingomonadales bacterium]
MKFPFRTIAFDLDGTLVDSSPDLAAALNHMLVALGRQPIALSDVLTMVGSGARTLLKRGFAATGTVDDTLVERGYPIFMQYYVDHICDLTRPYPGIESAMDALQDMGVSLAICTNKPEAAAHILVDALGWQSRFSVIIGGDTLSVLKPDPAPLHLAIARAGGGQAAFVGDSIIDVQTAQAAHVPSIAVSFGFADRPVDQMGATATIDRFDDLIPTLARLH